MPTPHGFVERLAELSQSGVPFVCVTMVQAQGSTPQEAGSKMLVTAGELITGTVGGGRVEHKAIEHARKMLAQPVNQTPLTELVEWNLKRDVGMTCGGSVKLFFETYNHSDWRIVVFGAGHVANAVVECLAPLDCHVTCIDSRAEWLDRIPNRARLRKVQCAEPRTLVAELPSDAFVICMTMGHATDRPILEEIFRQNRQVPFLGRHRQQSKAGRDREGTHSRRHRQRERRSVSLPDRPRPRHESAGRDRDQRRGATNSRARPLAGRRRKRRPEIAANGSCNRAALRTLIDTRVADTGWRSRSHRRRTSACSHQIPASGRAGTSTFLISTLLCLRWLRFDRPSSPKVRSSRGRQPPCRANNACRPAERRRPGCTRQLIGGRFELRR